MKQLLVALLITSILLTCSCTVNINIAEKPEDKEAIAEESEVIEPEVIEPEAVEPEVVEPEAVEPEVVEPEVVEPEVVEPEVVEPEADEPEAVEPEVVEPEAVEPDVVEPEAVEPEVVKPEVVEPEVVEPEVIEPEAVEPEAVEPEAMLKSELTIEPAPLIPLAIGDSESVTFVGVMDEDASVSHTFVPSIDGTYRFEICKLEGNKPNLYVIDQNGNYLANKAFAGENEGCTVSLDSDVTYSVKIKGGSCSYTLKIWKQKPIVDISEYTLVNDSMEFSQQSNIYTFIPSINGTYGVGIAEGDNGIKVGIRIEDAEGNLISRSAGVSDGENIYGDNFIGGETYVIRVTQSNGYGIYNMSIGLQQPIVDITDYLAVHDSLVFTGQKNIYSFTAKDSTVHTFTLTYSEGYKHGMSIHVYDREGNRLTHHNYCLSGDSVSINATAGQNYVISVHYYLLPVKYTLTVTP